MLGEGVRAAFDFHGLELRTVCYVEREAYAAAQLVALMEAQCLDAAPVWSNLRTFDGSAWRGAVDCVIAGFPCQDLSVAGKRAGLDGARSGLFFDVLRIAHDCGARWLILENVAGIASAGASVVDEGQDLEERAAARVMGELADVGWDAEWLHVSAADVGASHRRERWLCFAWLANAGSEGRQNPEQQIIPGTRGWDQRGAIGQFYRTLTIFAPGPTDERWTNIIRSRPDLAPATEPGVRLLVDGMAGVVDASRSHQLRAVGNGVVPLCAAAALVELMRRAA